MHGFQCIFAISQSYKFAFLTLCRKAARAREDQLNDVAKMMTFFTKCKQENPQFYCDYQLDKTGKFVSIFWSYASMQGEYADFGDAVTFDTTHKTNLYQKPLAPFVGANHRLQCTVFGIALLGDETTETFQWVFNTFKTCMGGKAPKCILTGDVHTQTNVCNYRRNIV
jgi:hypothetical protein